MIHAFWRPRSRRRVPRGLPPAHKRLHPRLRANPRFLDIYEGHAMKALIILAALLLVVALIALSLSIRVVTQYEKGVLFRLGKVVGVKDPGLAVIIPVIDRLMKVSLRIVTMPIQSQGIITRDNVSVDISAVAYFRVVDPVKSVIAIENVETAINQIAQTTLRKVVGQHTLDDALSETDVINANIQKILDVATLEWGVEVNLVELKDIQLPDSMKRAMARQAEAEREKRAKIIAAEGESMAAAALGDASDTMMAHPLALQLRNLQTLAELGVEKNTTVVFPAPMMSAIGEISSFLTRETAAAEEITTLPTAAKPPPVSATDMPTSGRRAPLEPSPAPRAVRIQVSLLPPPDEELTIREPRLATRVNAAGMTCADTDPASPALKCTKARRST